MKKNKTTCVTLIVDVEIPDSEISEPGALQRDLLGELVKIKSGIYDNLVMGNIVLVRITK